MFQSDLPEKAVISWWRRTPRGAKERRHGCLTRVKKRSWNSLKIQEKLRYNWANTFRKKSRKLNNTCKIALAKENMIYRTHFVASKSDRSTCEKRPRISIVKNNLKNCLKVTQNIEENTLKRQKHPLRIVESG